jgi:hypothetical protein
MLDRDHRLALLRERADDYLRVAIACVTQEYPHFPYFIATSPASYRTHRQLHPAFYGSFDWHSCVEMHWVAVRLMSLFPGLPFESRARETLTSLLTPENIAGEVAFFREPAHRTLERPYGWGWLLTLHHELAAWSDPDGRTWAATVEPLADLFADNLVDWLPRMTYPQRTGVHPNSAFALSRSLAAAEGRRAQGDPRLLEAISEAARRWFAADEGYPAHYEPSGADFLSPALTEAELMARLLPRPDWLTWLDRFLPELDAGRPEALFHPARVADSTDGQIAHLHGLNLSRAWAFVVLATRLPEDDPRRPALAAAAERHAAAALPQVVGGDYMVEHWLAAYATSLLSEA